jgi:hypothetical protein
VATEFKDTFIIFAHDPSNGASFAGVKGSYAEAIDLAETWADGDIYGVSYAVVPALAIAKVVE